MKTNNKQKHEQPKELYLKIPYHILNIPDIGLPEKILLAHFYSFGKKGCWQSNATLAEMFMVSEDTISRWISRIQKYVNVKCPRGYYRTIWAKSHPDVVAAGKALYEKKQTLKPDKTSPLYLGENAEHPRQKCLSDCRKSAFSLRQECGTTNNKTIKETTGETRATPSPLPAGGQAPALLAERKAQRDAVVASFYAKFGRSRKPYTPLPAEEFERRRREALEQMKIFSEEKKRPAAVEGVGLPAG